MLFENLAGAAIVNSVISIVVVSIVIIVVVASGVDKRIVVGISHAIPLAMKCSRFFLSYCR